MSIILLVESKLDKVYPMFSNWTTKAKITFPTLNYQINEISLLKNDLKNTILKAISSLDKQDKIQNRKIQGYDYGYFCGFIQGNLNVLWYNEYIYKQTNNYKILAAITTLDSFLKNNDLLKIRLSNLYSEYYKSEVNIEDLDCNIGMEIPKNLEFINMNNEESQILVAIENIRIDIINKMCNEEIPDFLDNITDLFSKEDVDEILALK